MGILIAAGITGLLVSAIVFYAGSDSGKASILNRINSAIAGNLSVETLKVALLDGTIEIRDLKIKDSGNREVAGVNRVFIDLSWTALASGEAAFAVLAIEKPWLKMHRDADGRYNIQDALATESEKKRQPGSGKGLPLNLVFQSITISDGRFTYHQESDGLEATGNGISFSGSGNIFRRAARAALSISSLRIGKPERILDLGTINAEAKLKESRIEDLKISASGPFLGLNLNGTAQDIFKTPLWKLKVNGHLRLDALSAFMAFPREMTGNLGFNASILGDLTDPEVNLALSYDGGLLAGTAVESAAGRLLLKNRNITLSDLDIRAASGRTQLSGEIVGKSAFANGIFQPPTDVQAISYHLTARQQHFDLNAIASDARGVVDSDIHVSGKGISPETLNLKVVASANGTQLTVNPNVAPVDMRIKVRADMDGGIVHIEDLAAAAGNLMLHLRGRTDLSSLAMEGDIDLSADDLAASLAPLGVRDIRGGLSLKAAVSGSPHRPIFQVKGRGQDLNFKEIAFGDVAFDAAMDTSGILEVKELAVNNRGSVVKGSGRIRIFGDDNSDLFAPTLDFKASLNNIEIQDFYPWSVVVGTFGAELHMAGALKTLKAHAKISGKQVRILENYHLGDARADISWNAGRLRVKDLNSDNGRSALSVSGALQLLEPGTFTGLHDPLLTDARLTGTISLEDILKDFSGAVIVDASLGGRLLRPTGKFSLQAERIATPVQDFSRVSVSGGLTENAVNIADLQASPAPGEPLWASGRMTYDGQFSVNLDANEIATESIRAFSDQEVFGGRLSATVRGSGNISDPTITARIRMDNVTINEKPLDNFTLDVDVKNRIATLNGKLNFDLKGSYDFNGSDFTLTAGFENTELSPYMKLLNRPELSGTLTGNVTAGGNANHPDAITARVDITDIAMKVKDLQAVNSGTVKGGYADGRLNLEDLRLKILDQGWIRARGTGELDKKLDVQANGQIPFAVAGRFMKSLQSTEGNVLFSIGLAGSIKQPAMEATVDLADLGFTTDQWPQRFHHISGRIHATPEKAAISNLTGNLDSGRFTIEGEAALDNFNPQHLNIRLKSSLLPIRVPDTLNLTVNTDLTLSGAPDDSRLEGNITIAAGEYFKDVRMQLLEGVGKKQRPPSTSQSLAVDAPFLRQLSLNVAIKRLTPFRVDNNLAELEISPDLQIGGTLARPAVSGRTNIDSGVMKYRKKTFTVTKGSVDFLNPYGIEPTITLESETRIRNWDIFLRLSGTPEQMQLAIDIRAPGAGIRYCIAAAFRKNLPGTDQRRGRFHGLTRTNAGLHDRVHVG